MSGCAFSISSSNTTQYGFLRTFSLSCPPSSYPTYPGGAPISLDTENFSMYSLMSILTILSLESNKYSARHLASSVLPTPVGPKNRKDPIGLSGSFSPARLLWIALTIVSMASSCPMMRSLSLSLMWNSLTPSDSATLFTGIPVILDTTVAMSSALTTPFFAPAFIRTSEPASSIASIALSGRNWSGKYLSVSLTQASRAASSYLTL